VRAAKHELADLIRAAVLGGGATAGAPTTSARLDDWVKACTSRLVALVQEQLSDEKPGRYERGTWSFSYALEEPIELSLNDLMDVMRRAHQSVTGWPVFLVMDKEDCAPYPVAGAVEAWIRSKGDLADAAHSDFWRASPDGRLFLLRGYQEDGDLPKVTPGTSFDHGLPIGRIGECLLHVQRFAALVGRQTGRALVRAEWTGLEGRRLGVCG
jgi:hypothetical protein